MASSSSNLPIFACIVCFALIGSSTASPLCAPPAPAFLDELRSECPLWIEPSPAAEVNGDFIDRELNYHQRNAYKSVLFYSSRCPFSHDIRPTFDVLSSMFPQIRHFAVEESSTLPVMFSRSSVHSFPTIILAGQKITVHFHGSKDLISLIRFYKEITGLEPVAYFGVDEPSRTAEARPFSPWNGSLKEMITNEPYLVFGSLFIILKLLLPFLLKFFSHLKALLASHALRLNIRNFGELSQLLERMRHLIDVKKLWIKLRLCNKNRNFQHGARNARALASSLASVSLGESSSSRLVLLDS